MNDWERRRVLVTGATGIVGSWLCRRLLEAGAQVVTLIRDADPQSELLRSRTINLTTVVNGVLEAIEDVERSVNDHEVDTIFHLGAQTIVGTAARSPRPTLATNIEGTINVLEVARRLPSLVQRVVIASSDKAYGSQLTLPYTEDMPLSGRAPYEVSKSCADLIAQSYGLTYGLPVGIVRCGNIYGGGDLNWSRIVPGTIRSLLRGAVPILRSDGTFLRDYLHVDDAVSAYLAVADGLADHTRVGRAYNVAGAGPLTVRQVYDAICLATVGGPVEPEVLNDAPGEIRDQFLSATRITAELGWVSQVSLEEGLTRTVDWYRELLAAS